MAYPRSWCLTPAYRSDPCSDWIRAVHPGRMAARLHLSASMDPLARKVSIGFPGGSLTATRGLLIELFGEELANTAAPVASSVSVNGHTRVRVIGGDATSVGSYSYGRKKYPTGSAGGGSGGEPIRFLVGADYWTARLSGSHQALNDWLASGPGSGASSLIYKSEKGTTYGPFAQVVA